MDVTLVPGKGKVCHACLVETSSLFLVICWHICHHGGLNILISSLFIQFSLVCLVSPLNINMCNISRYWITQRRCEKTLQHLPATPHERLPLLHHPDHPMSKIGRHRIFVRLHKHPNVILVRSFFFFVWGWGGGVWHYLTDRFRSLDEWQHDILNMLLVLLKLKFISCRAWAVFTCIACTSCAGKFFQSLAFQVYESPLWSPQMLLCNFLQLSLLCCRKSTENKCTVTGSWWNVIATVVVCLSYCFNP